jgi:hypothetical protein
MVLIAPQGETALLVIEPHPSNDGRTNAIPLWRTISRRGFLLLLGGIGSLGAAALLFRDSISTVLRRLDLDVSAGTGTLTGHNSRTLSAFGDVLIPSSFALETPAAQPPKGSAQAEILESLQLLAAEEPGFWLEARAAVELLDRLSKAEHLLPFAELRLSDRRKLIDRIFRPYVTGQRLWRPYYLATIEGRRRRRVWLLVAKPILTAFYSSSLGWSMVGYQRRPGECSNLVDYTLPGQRTSSIPRG